MTSSRERNYIAKGKEVQFGVNYLGKLRGYKKQNYFNVLQSIKTHYHNWDANLAEATWLVSIRRFAYHPGPT